MLTLRLRVLPGFLTCCSDADGNGVNGFKMPPSFPRACCVRSRALNTSLSLAVRVTILLSSCDLLRRRDSGTNSSLCSPELDVEEEDAD